MLRATVNNVSVRLSAGSTLLDAVRAAKSHVPTLCFNARLTPHATCRVCVVERNGKTVPACATPLHDGDVIVSDSPALSAFRIADMRLLLDRHPQQCASCAVNGNCKLQSIVAEQPALSSATWNARPRPAGDADHSSISIDRDLDKCIECGLCVQACHDQAIDAIGFARRGGATMPVTAFDAPLHETDCISCGQCTAVCPVGALVEKPAWQHVLDVLATRRRPTVVQVAPATRVAISEEFGLPPGTVSTGRLVNALRLVGFDFVFDTNFSADLTIMEEASELLARVQNNGVLPLFTSCCPAWVNYVELKRPDLIAHLSTTKSPQQMHGALSKRGPFAMARGEQAAEPFVVAVMPCTAKKDEALRPAGRGDVDAVLTTRELGRMLRSRRIAFAALPNDGEFDNPLGESTGAAQLFGSSGGVLEAALRTAHHLAGLPGAFAMELKELRGVAKGVKELEVPGIGRVAACNGIASAIELLANDDWRRRFVAIEVMSCVGGCLGGGGEPKSDAVDILAQRARGVYAIDEAASKRNSHDNVHVQRLYNTFLERPLSHRSELLLHTSYAARNGARDLLARFLGCVDARDGDGAAALCAPDVVWQTNSAFGELRGRAAVAQLIGARLAAAGSGPALRRHRFVVPNDESLDVIAANGERVRFDVELNQSRQIAKLTRVPLHAT